MPRKKQERNVTRARRLRGKMSLPQVLLWQILRREPEGIKIRREHPIDIYAIDFYYAQGRIGFEIDGIAHDMGDRPERDERRAEVIAAEGIELVRIPARDVLRSPEAVAEMIVRYCQR
ncbi:MAG: DUF559 domain-containing protein [Novosphingobium sp.]